MPDFPLQKSFGWKWEGHVWKWRCHQQIVEDHGVGINHIEGKGSHASREPEVFSYMNEFGDDFTTQRGSWTGVSINYPQRASALLQFGDLVQFIQPYPAPLKELSRKRYCPWGGHPKSQMKWWLYTQWFWLLRLVSLCIIVCSSYVLQYSFYFFCIF